MRKIINLEAKVLAALAASVAAGETINVEAIATQIDVSIGPIYQYRLHTIINDFKINNPPIKPDRRSPLETKLRTALTDALVAGEPISIKHIVAKSGISAKTIRRYKLHTIINDFKINNPPIKPDRRSPLETKLRTALTDALAAGEPIFTKHIAAKSGISEKTIRKYKLHTIINDTKITAPRINPKRRSALEVKVRAAIAEATAAGEFISERRIAAKIGVSRGTLQNYKLNTIINDAKPKPKLEPLDLSSNQYPPIPPTTTTHYKHVVNTSDDIWQIPVHAYGNRQGRINWTLFTALAPEALHVTRLYIVHELEISKPGTAISLATLLRHFDQWLSEYAPTLHVPLPFQWASLDEKLFRDYKQHCEQTLETKGQCPNNLRQFYRWAAPKNYPGFSSATYKRIKRIKMQGHQQGKAVLYDDPTYGPFSPDEHRQIVKAILAEIGTPLQRTIAMLLFELGVRPGVLPLLKNKHLIKYTDGESTRYFLDVPRFKKASTSDETIRRRIDAPLAQLLYTMQGNNPEDPLIPDLNVKYATAANHYLEQWAKLANLRSRDGSTQLNVSPTRFRRSLATRMLANGATIHEVAKILDHTRAETTWLYAQANSRIAQKADAAIAPAMSANQVLWEGKVIADNDPQAQTLPTIPGVIPDPTTSQILLAHGKCGLQLNPLGSCRLQTGLECYNCPDFYPLASGPHEEIRDAVKHIISQLRDDVDPHVRAFFVERLIQIEHVISEANKIRGTHESIHAQPIDQQPTTLELPTPHPSPARV